MSPRVGLSLLMLACAACASTLQAPAPFPTGAPVSHRSNDVARQATRPPGTGRSNEASARHFLAERRADFSRRQELLRQRGLDAELERLRSYVRERWTRSGRLSDVTDPTQAELDASWTDQMAVRMVELGRSAAEAQELERRGFDLVKLFDLGSPNSSLLSPAAHAEHVVVGEVTAVNGAEDIGDGRHSSIHFRNVETVSGTMQRGESFVIRLFSGCMPGNVSCVGVSGEPMPGSIKLGARYLLFVSRAALAQELRKRGAAPPPPQFTFNMNELIEIEGDRLLPTHSFAGGTLAGARAELAPFARAQAEVRALFAARER